MKYLIIFLILFMLLVLQAGLVSNLGLGSVGNLLLLFVVVSAILSDFEESFFTCLVGGLMMDLAASSRAGILVLCFLAVLGFTHLFINKLVPREPNRLILFICAAINTLLFSLVFMAVNQLLNLIHIGTPIDWKFLLGRKLLADLAVNVILIYPMFLFYVSMQNLQKRLPKFT